MTSILEVAVVGAGPAGLGVSYFLRQRGISHVLLERARIGETWRTQRWDSFHVNSTNIRTMLPGDAYQGADPWGALTHHELVAYFEDYADRHGLPVRCGRAVVTLEREGGIYRLRTDEGTVHARMVVVATGNQNQPIRPAWSTDVPPDVHQVDTSTYRNPSELPPGAVLVVGSGQSGGQIAEDLLDAGRRVFLATSRTSRLVRRYRGGDAFNWLTLSGFADVPREQLIAADGKLPARPLLGATHTISLQSLSARGAILLGHFQGARDGQLTFGADVDDHISFANKASADIKRIIDEYIELAGLNAPRAEEDPAEAVLPIVPNPPIRSLDLAESGIASIVWCTGFSGDFSWIKIAGVLDHRDQPLHDKGLSPIAGLYFAGLDFALTRKSGTIPAIAEEAEQLVDRIHRNCQGSGVSA